MRLTSERLKELLEKPAIKARNPGLVTVGAVQREQDPQPALDTHVQREQAPGKALGYVVSIVVFRKRLLDDDNSVGSVKHLRDIIARHIGLDDGDERVKWQYSQVRTDGEPGTLVVVQSAKTS